MPYPFRHFPAPNRVTKEPTMPTSYLIQINEAQRVALAKLLAANVHQFQQPDPDNLDPSDPAYHPLRYWLSMLEDLPKDDQMGTDPVTGEPRQQINGFCL